MAIPEIDLDVTTLQWLPREKLIKTKRTLKQVLAQAERVSRRVSELSKQSQTEKIERVARAVHESSECVSALGGVSIIRQRIRLINVLLSRRY